MNDQILVKATWWKNEGPYRLYTGLFWVPNHGFLGGSTLASSLGPKIDCANSPPLGFPDCVFGGKDISEADHYILADRSR